MNAEFLKIIDIFSVFLRFIKITYGINCAAAEYHRWSYRKEL